MVFGDKGLSGGGREAARVDIGRQCTIKSCVTCSLFMQDDSNSFPPTNKMTQTEDLSFFQQQTEDPRNSKTKQLRKKCVNMCEKYMSFRFVLQDSKSQMLMPGAVVMV